MGENVYAEKKLHGRQNICKEVHYITNMIVGIGETKL